MISSSPIFDEGSPYYLKVEGREKGLECNLLTGEGNFATWKEDVQIALTERRKFVFASGALQKPNDHLSAAWTVNDGKVKKWIMDAIAVELHPYLRGCKTAAELWRLLDLKLSPGGQGFRPAGAGAGAGDPTAAGENPTVAAENPSAAAENPTAAGTNRIAAHTSHGGQAPTGYTCTTPPAFAFASVNNPRDAFFGGAGTSETPLSFAPTPVTFTGYLRYGDPPDPELIYRSQGQSGFVAPPIGGQGQQHRSEGPFGFVAPPIGGQGQQHRSEGFVAPPIQQHRSGLRSEGQFAPPIQQPRHRSEAQFAHLPPPPGQHQQTPPPPPPASDPNLADVIAAVFNAASTINFFFVLHVMLLALSVYSPSHLLCRYVWMAILLSLACGFFYLMNWSKMVYIAAGKDHVPIGEKIFYGVSLAIYLLFWIVNMVAIAKLSCQKGPALGPAASPT